MLGDPEVLHLLVAQPGVTQVLPADAGPDAEPVADIDGAGGDDIQPAVRLGDLEGRHRRAPVVDEGMRPGHRRDLKPGREDVLLPRRARRHPCFIVGRADQAVVPVAGAVDDA